MRSQNNTGLCIFFSFLIWSWSPMFTSAAWWWLDVKPPTEEQEQRPRGHRQYCESFPHLTRKQRNYCHHHPQVLAKVSEGYRDAIQECQFQMKDRKWNCPTNDDDSKDSKKHVFDPVLKLRGKERAFIQALFSAAISYTVTRSCTLDKLNTDCGCAEAPPYGQKLPEPDGKWGGCSDDISFGVGASKIFMDDIKRPKSANSKIDLHNNRVGRLTIQRYKHTTCKCHGLSGACTQNICWVSLPTMKEVGASLKSSYDNATQIKVKKGKFVQTSTSKRPKAEDLDLIYTKFSPSFCNRNKRQGFPGTSGRLCDPTSAKEHGCRTMCCGRPHTTKVVKEEINCRCVFLYCCELKCQTCTKMYNQSRCT